MIGPLLYVEAITIVSRDEQKGTSEFRDKTGDIAQFVHEHDLNSLNYLDRFITALILLIECKHECDTGGDNAYPRVEYEVPLTVNPIPVGYNNARDGVHHEHSSIFGYGHFKDRSDYVTDKRQKRNATTTMTATS